ncbi:hypothetical protein BT96DRAFT_962482 [Gymnopus androsaceus JB14]|uniref:Micro-fibrillar-associated protein 1 C-terminal domain-containing protein n=1 Tax=Gymnopus androsaceus JB14 TaxID=1447944 RepID=A0A6A4IFL7_9AGAR|nr:hypothetical protein BT96DRAFT_962482 [Gymnopus androsaceus JB14]
MSSKPKQAPRMARPAARYWRGKAPKNAYEEQPEVEQEGDINIGGDQEIVQEEDDEEEEDMPMKKEALKSKSMNIALRDVNISREGKVIVAGREESGKTALEEEEEESEDESEEDVKKVEESEEESSEDESDSEEEEKPKLQFRPVFVPKRKRETISEREKMAQDTEEALKRKEMEMEERRKQSHDLVAESIRRELAEKEKEEEVPDVDDTDGLDPAGEFEQWRLRELARIKREKEDEVRREQEREEIERRRAMPEEQRMKEDVERAQKLRDEKPKGQQKFLQKFWHKGAFHQDEEILRRHDFTEATESTVDVSLLPKVMQVKDFGKRSRTKYTHLLDQDTTVTTGGFGGVAPVKAGGKSTETGGCFLCGGPHMKKAVKVAVIGSGLAGLTAAFLLSGSSSEEIEFEVHVFEKSSALGMDSASMTLPVPGKEKEWRIDVPMRSFQGGYYNNLISLYTHLGIPFRKTNFSYSFSRLTPKSGDSSTKITTDMIYNGNSGTAGVSMPSSMIRDRTGVPSSSFAIRAATEACVYGTFVLISIRLLILYLRIMILSIPIFRPHRVEEMTFRTWSTMTVPRGFLARWTMLDLAWIEFSRDVLAPLFSAVCTAPESTVYDHPVEEFLDYIWLTLGYHHYVALNGVQEVVSKLTARVQHIHLSSPITSIQTNPHDHATSSVEVSTSSGPRIYTGFHHVVFATQANRAIPLLESFRRAVQEQITCLRQFTYCSTVVINHTDPSLLPDDIRDKRDLNLLSSVPAEVGTSNSEALLLQCLPSSYTMATHILTPPEGYPAHLPSVYQTTNPIVQPRESRILILTVQSKRALKGLNVEYGRKWWQAAGQGKSRLGPLQGARPCNEIERTPGIWICGSFAYFCARSVVEQGIWKSEQIQRHIPW